MSESPIQQIVCCMGQPVAGNPNQFMMERAFSAAGLDWRYLTLEIPPDRLGDAIKGMRAMGFRGGNFAAPHKTAVMEHLDEVSESARLIGAVNCVLRVGDRLCGENTEGKAVVQALRPIVDPAGKRVVILGAGGMARAIAIELGLAGAAEIIIANRTADHGQRLVEQLVASEKVAARLVHLSGDYAVEQDVPIIINATSIGGGDSEACAPLRLDCLTRDMCVVDVAINPSRTRLIREAEARGCATLNGLGTLVNQVAIAFETWTGAAPDLGVIREAIEEYLDI